MCVCVCVCAFENWCINLKIKYVLIRSILCEHHFKQKSKICCFIQNYGLANQTLVNTVKDNKKIKQEKHFFKF